MSQKANKGILLESCVFTNREHAERRQAHWRSLKGFKYVTRIFRRDVKADTLALEVWVLTVRGKV